MIMAKLLLIIGAFRGYRELSQVQSMIKELIITSLFGGKYSIVLLIISE